MARIDFDCIVVGGGLVGATLALALGRNGIRVAVIEAVEFTAEIQPSYDDRALALALSSTRILSALGLSKTCAEAGSPMRRVHVSDEGHFGAVRLAAEQLGVSELGRVMVARHLGGALVEAMGKTGGISSFCPAKLSAVTRRNGQVLVKVDADRGELELSAPLLIGADGTDSLTRRLLGVEIDELDYQQSAVVTTVRPERAHNDTAFERFTPQGALAALPLSEGRCNLVVIASHAEVESLAALGDERFCADISQRFGGRLGRLSEPGRHHTYALRRTKAKAVHGERFVLLGNAAQTVHPNAAQGLNLGLRQVAVLAEELVAAHRAGTDLGDATTLSAFAACSAADRERVLQFTHGLGAFFYNNFAPAIALRGSAMLMLDMIPAFKRHVIEVFAGLSKPQPKLVQGLPL